MLFTLNVQLPPCCKPLHWVQEQLDRSIGEGTWPEIDIKSMRFSLILRKTRDNNRHNTGTEAHMSFQSVMWEPRNWGLGKISETGDKSEREFPKQEGKISLRREVV